MQRLFVSRVRRLEPVRPGFGGANAPRAPLSPYGRRGRGCRAMRLAFQINSIITIATTGNPNNPARNIAVHTAPRTPLVFILIAYPSLDHLSATPTSSHPITAPAIMANTIKATSITNPLHYENRPGRCPPTAQLALTRCDSCPVKLGAIPHAAPNLVVRTEFRHRRRADNRLAAWCPPH